MRTTKDWEEQAESKPITTMLRLCVYVFLAIFLIVCLATTCGFMANPFKQASRIINKTIDADNVIYNYEWFKNRYQDIESIDAKIASAQRAVSTFKTDAGERSTWHREDREEHSRLSSILLGLRQQRNDLAAQYNARSAMANRAIFKTGELPESITIE